MQQTQVTPRQREVLDLLVKGYTNQQIAQKLGISLEGAKWHVREILEVTGASSREEAAEMWRAENGLPRRLWRMTWSAGAIAAAAAGIAVVIAGVVLVLSNRGDSDKELAEPTAEPTASATPSPTVPASTPTVLPSPTATARPLLPPSRTTGDALMDNLISHVEAGRDWDRSLIGTTAVPCRVEVYITHPECPSGAPEDTLVDSVFLFRCEAKWVDPDRVTELGDRTTTLVLHSVALGGRSYTRSPIAPEVPDYWILFRGEGPPGSWGFAVAVADGKTVSWGGACSTFEQFEQRMLEGSTGYLVAPP